MATELTVDQKTALATLAERERELIHLIGQAMDVRDKAQAAARVAYDAARQAAADAYAATADPLAAELETVRAKLHGLAKL